MNPVQLQRVVVRLLYDPAFVAEVYGGGPVQGLDAGARALLVAVDRRAWGTDPYRRSRTLTALLEEYPASAALAGVERLDAFFSSLGFHAAVMERVAIAEAFGSWIRPLAGSVADLELGVAKARRDLERDSVPWTPAPGVVTVGTAGGTLARWQAVRARLGPDPVDAVVRGRVDLRGLPETSGEEHLLVEPGPQGLAVGEIPHPLFALLDAARPHDREALLSTARALGVEPGEDAEVVDGLVADGLLVGRS